VRGFVPPNLFIPIADRFGLIGTIGNWVIDEAYRQMSEWKKQGLRMRVAVNLCVHQLRQEDLVQRVKIVVDHFRVDPALLTFEITESVATEDTQETMRAFSQLANPGVMLSIDDFGTRQDAPAVVDAVIKLAHALGLHVVAEGVETARQRDILLSLQCDELQGYPFARPMADGRSPADAVGDGRGQDRVAHGPGRRLWPRHAYRRAAIGRLSDCFLRSACPADQTASVRRRHPRHMRTDDEP
jgi:EAL domain-containing protein (putative c-di-GMP-specific phosphodiesterase class I)